jgi:hypothetical protein
MFTFDQATIDSTGSFYINELERLDQAVHEPLVDITWGRDIMLREDITIGDETSSFTNSTFGSVGGFRPAGKSWVGKNTTQIQRVQLDIMKTANPLTLWGEELSYSLPELASAAQVGRPIDTQMYDALRTKHQMDIDEQVYIGDVDLGFYGLTNSPNVTATNVVAGTAGYTQWIKKQPTEILNDFNTALTTCWAASGWAVAPASVRIPPNQFGYLFTPPVTTAGSESIGTYVMKNNIYTARTGRQLDIQYLKWLIGRGVSGADRMMVYTNRKDYVRFPMTDLQKTPVEYRSLQLVTTYWGRLGVVEMPRPNTLLYADGI